MPLEDFASPTEWIQDLDVRWPERTLMKASLLETAIDHISALDHPPRILELGIGDGELLEALSLVCPHAQLVGVDINPALLTSGSKRLSGFSAVTFAQQDLRERQWAPIIGKDFDLIFSLQSFHDLGGRSALQAVYDRSIARLRPGGLLLNADFVEPMPQDNPAQPRRFPFREHVAILQRLDVRAVELAHQYGKLGCIAAYGSGGEFTHPVADSRHSSR